MKRLVAQDQSLVIDPCLWIMRFSQMGEESNDFLAPSSSNTATVRYLLNNSSLHPTIIEHSHRVNIAIKLLMITNTLFNNFGSRTSEWRPLPIPSCSLRPLEV